jgi:hypothetical protein
MKKFILFLFIYSGSFKSFAQRELSPPNLLINTTVRIVGYKDTIIGGIKKWIYTTGTGFFYEFQIDSLKFMAIVTNKHVVEESTFGILTFKEKNNYILGNRIISDTINISKFNEKWIMHLNEDLAILPFSNIEKYFFKKYKKEILHSWFDKRMIPILSDSLKISSIEKVLMIGYPQSLWDSTNNLPIVRQGITATPYFSNFNGKKRFLLDIPTFHGSSGSPVLLYSYEPYWIDTTMLMNEFRTFLLGIVVETYTYDTEGELIGNNSKPLLNDSLAKNYKPKVSLPFNIAIVIKAEKLYEFEPLIRKYLTKNKN